jgi:hypothetical protein
MTKQPLRIPEQFELHGITYRVVFQKNLLATKDNLGESDYNSGQITIQSLDDDLPMEADRQGQTFCHELIHMILFEAKEDKLNKDEDLVDILGSLLHQALTTAVYPKGK